MPFGSAVEQDVAHLRRAWSEEGLPGATLVGLAYPELSPFEPSALSSIWRLHTVKIVNLGQGLVPVGAGNSWDAVWSFGLFLEGAYQVIAVEAGDEVEADFLGADSFAGAGDGAVAEAFLVHGVDHFDDALVAFRLALGEEAKV